MSPNPPNLTALAALPAVATTRASTFRMTCSVTIEIRATPARIWALLTDAAGFPRWNSTVTSIAGTIARGERLALRVPAAPGRLFKPRVTAFEPGATMTWSDGVLPMFKGVRTFTLRAADSGITTFTMSETFRGVLLRLIKRALPDFAPMFTAYAADLKREAERGE